MNKTIMTILFAGSTSLVGVQAAAAAASPPPFANVIVRALVDGNAEEPIRPVASIAPMLAKLKAQAGGDGPIYLQAMRVTRFVSQSRCGRVAFAMRQPSTHHIWPALGGELNICEDGLPPLRVCADRPTVLVPPTAKCANGEIAKDTPEVAEAIAAAFARGGLTAQQARAAAAGAASGAAR